MAVDLRWTSGLVVALVCGCAGAIALVFAPGDTIVNFVAFGALPFLCALLITKRLSHSIIWVWVNEVFFGSTGRWLVLGPLSIRWILLMLVAVMGMVDFCHAIFRHQPRERYGRAQFHELMLIFAGLVYPTWLVFYSSVIMQTPIIQAVADVNYLVAALSYFALRIVVRAHDKAIAGWLIGATIVESCLFLIMAFLPRDAALLIAKGLLVGTTEVIFGTTSGGINRTAMLTQVLVISGFYFGLLHVLKRKVSAVTFVLSSILCTLSISSFIVFYLRGPLIAIFAVNIILIGLLLRRTQYRYAASRLSLITVAVCIAVVVAYLMLIPEAVTRFSISEGDNVADFVSLRRVDQAQEMIRAFLENPFFGKGVGVPLGQLDDGSLNFELQYLMLLYRLGLVNCFILVVIVGYFLKELFRPMQSLGVLINSSGTAALSFLLALVVILVSGFANPYLTTVYTAFFASLYLAFRRVATRSETLLFN